MSYSGERVKKHELILESCYIVKQEMSSNTKARPVHNAKVRRSEDARALDTFDVGCNANTNNIAISDLE